MNTYKVRYLKSLSPLIRDMSNKTYMYYGMFSFHGVHIYHRSINKKIQAEWISRNPVHNRDPLS